MSDRRGLVLVAGAVALLAVGAGIVVSMLIGGGRGVGLASPSPAIASDSSGPSPGSPSPTPASSATPEATEAPTPTAQPSGPATIAWSEGESHAGGVRQIVRWDDVWIAGGSVDLEGAYRAAVWTSLDGLSWNGPLALPPESVPNEDGITPRYWINGFGEWNGGLLAFGWNGVGAGDGGYPMLWQSVDGESWSVVDTTGSDFDSYHFPQRSVATPQGDLAVLTGTGLGSGASIFVTEDLETWEEHPLTTPELLLQVTGLAASPSRLMVVGTETHPFADVEDRRTTPHAWVSIDGRTWTSLTPPSTDGTLDRVTWDPLRERFVAVGTDAAGVPAAWLTADGSTWSAIPLAEETGQMHDIAAVTGLIVASGTVGPLFEPSGETIAWTSHDGVTWRVLPLVDRQAGSVVGATPGSAVMIVNGWDEEAGDGWQSWAGPVDE